MCVCMHVCTDNLFNVHVFMCCTVLDLMDLLLILNDYILYSSCMVVHGVLKHWHVLRFSSI